MNFLTRLDVQAWHPALYGDQVPKAVISFFQDCFNYDWDETRSRNRYRFYYGSLFTGLADGCWDTGYIAVTVLLQVPYVLHNTRSAIGPTIRMNDIIKIDGLGGSNRTIYRHPLFHTAAAEIVPETEPESGRMLRRVKLQRREP